MNVTQTPCVCGATAAEAWARVDGVDIIKCIPCGVRRVAGVVVDEYLRQYQSGDYHSTDRSGDTGHKAHPDRIAHDRHVAKLRLSKLSRVKTSGKLLDVGCSNGAFVMEAVDAGFDAYGCDLSVDAVPEAWSSRVRARSLDASGFIRRSLDAITMNDVLEHLIDPVDALRAAKGMLKRDGILAIEIPDMGSEQALREGPGFYHLKPHEHLWHFTGTQLRTLLESMGFFVVWMDAPVPGKVTVYATPEAKVERVRVYGPPGIGDILWTLNKLADIREREAPCRLEYVVCVNTQQEGADRSRDFLDLCGLVDCCDFETLPLPKNAVADDPREAKYSLFANPHVDAGHRIEDWKPELQTIFEIDVHVPAVAERQAAMRIGSDPYVVLFMSSAVWNEACTGGQTWPVSDWAKLALRLSAAGLRPVVLGLGWDRKFADAVGEEIVKLGRRPVDVWLNMTGRTPLPLAMAVMQGAVATIGICAGLTILSAYFGWPTISFWPKPGALPFETQISAVVKEGFSDCWMPPMVLASGSYRNLHFGEFGVDDVFEHAMSLRKTPVVAIQEAS